ncbi:hypothetical protein EVG20_g6203 [Dentipellis fragilis]|uniref:F-box domain-containing protein n=1 Tax=Dentipellis fragilis TaxID=205917 RepID=A0A4Y9YPU6_9AGAM|nr:hypothetical protein EVG20_g6203 [Dentipellis fragilis]
MCLAQTSASHIPVPFTMMMSPPRTGSPIAGLPQDVLKYLFEVGTWQSDVVEDNIAFPLLVSQVCRYWRLTAFAMPTLWTAISLTGEPQDTEYYPLQRRSLALSGDCPLTVFVALHYSDTPLDTEYLWDSGPDEYPINTMARRLETLKDHMERIKTLTVLSDDYTLIYIFMFWLSESGYMFSKLEFLDVTFKGFGIRDNHKDGMSHGQDPIMLPPQLEMPALKSLFLSGTSTGRNVLPSAGLTHLSLCSPGANAQPSVANLRKLLRTAARTLEFLEIQHAAPELAAADDNAQHDTLEDERIVLPNVRELILGYLFPMEAVTMLKLCSYPRVQKLTIKDAMHTYEDGEGINLQDATPIMEALLLNGNHLPAVEDLTLEGILCDSAFNLAAEVLGLFPAMYTLVLNDCAPEFIPALSTPLRLGDTHCDSLPTPPLSLAAHPHHRRRKIFERHPGARRAQDPGRTQWRAHALSGSSGHLLDVVPKSCTCVSFQVCIARICTSWRGGAGVRRGAG